MAQEWEKVFRAGAQWSEIGDDVGRPTSPIAVRGVLMMATCEASVVKGAEPRRRCDVCACHWYHR